MPFEHDDCGPCRHSHAVEVLVLDGPDMTTVDVRYTPGAIWMPLGVAGGSMRETVR